MRSRVIKAALARVARMGLLVVDDIHTASLQQLDRLYTRATVGAGGCWLWPDGRGRYGAMATLDGTARVHRVSWAVFKGKIPRGMGVCHRCDVTRCINPKHLFLGTQTENMRDMRAKGRGKPPPPTPRGAAHPNARLSDKQVAAIRRIGDSRTQRAIAKKFKCRQSTVWRILNNKTRVGTAHA